MAKTTTTFLAAGIFLLTLTVGTDVHAQLPNTSAGVSADTPDTPLQQEVPLPPTPTAVGVAVEDIESIGILKRISLVMQLLLTPAKLANNVAPLHAYDRPTVCGTTFRNAALEHVDLWGPAAIVQEDREAWQATYYTSIEDAYAVIELDGICSDSDAVLPYVATTFPVRNQQPDRQLLMMDAARSLPDWSKPDGR